MTINKNIINILRQRWIYVTILAFFIIFKVRSYNRTYQPEKLQAYYTERIAQQGADVVSLPVKGIPVAAPGRAVLNNDDKSRTINKLLSFAADQVGKPYVYGAMGPEKFDCSGFTTYVYRHVKTKLPHSSRAQFKMGKEIDMDDLQAGDLVFFKSPTPGNDQIGHVGMVTEVTPESIIFTHSSTRKGVIRTDLKASKHYQHRYRGGRRVL